MRKWLSKINNRIIIIENWRMKLKKIKGKIKISLVPRHSFLKITVIAPGNRHDITTSLISDKVYRCQSGTHSSIWKSDNQTKNIFLLPETNRRDWRSNHGLFPTTKPRVHTVLLLLLLILRMLIMSHMELRHVYETTVTFVCISTDVENMRNDATSWCHPFQAGSIVFETYYLTIDIS